MLEGNSNGSLPSGLALPVMTSSSASSLIPKSPSSAPRDQDRGAALRRTCDARRHPALR
jgi:hypothetical protein